jgi:hypothetical protein
MSATKPTPAEVLGTILDQAADAAVARHATTKRDRAWSRELTGTVKGRLAELRRGLLPAEAPVEKAKPIRPSTLAMARDAVIAAITSVLQGMGGTVQVAHRNLTQLSDDDLRRLYDLIDPTSRE